MKNQSKGIAHLLNAFKYSIDGFKWAFKKEVAFRHDILFAIVVLTIVAITTDFNLIRCAIVLSAFLLLLIVELLNTAIECVVDIVSPEYNILAKATKDMCSTAVFIAIILVFVATLSVIFL